MLIVIKIEKISSLTIDVMYLKYHFSRFFAACHPEFISGSPWLYGHALPHTCGDAEINSA